MDLKNFSKFIVITLGATHAVAGSTNAAEVFPPCPDSPNCVSSLSEDKRHFVDPFTYDGTIEKARQKLIKILEKTRRTHLVTNEKNYLHVEFRSFLFRFVDDVQFFLPPDESVIHIKSASRSGYYDFGANRRRVERLRAAFYGTVNDENGTLNQNDQSR